MKSQPGSAPLSSSAHRASASPSPSRAASLGGGRGGRRSAVLARCSSPSRRPSSCAVGGRAHGTANRWCAGLTPISAPNLCRGAQTFSGQSLRQCERFVAADPRVLDSILDQRMPRRSRRLNPPCHLDGLSDDLVLRLFSRAPFMTHGTLHVVCRRLKTLLRSPEFLQQRVETGLVEHGIVVAGGWRDGRLIRRLLDVYRRAVAADRAAERPSQWCLLCHRGG